mmetsp:Transcript_17137/g.49698  ORF Transcript_17137/g.49698 Transcript_17137/m.49698 type:complete len:469 (-) Transcript_17137:558-1964(-)
MFGGAAAQVGARACEACTGACKSALPIRVGTLLGFGAPTRRGEAAATACPFASSELCPFRGESDRSPQALPRAGAALATAEAGGRTAARYAGAAPVLTTRRSATATGSGDAAACWRARGASCAPMAPAAAAPRSPPLSSGAAQAQRAGRKSPASSRNNSEGGGATKCTGGDEGTSLGCTATTRPEGPEAATPAPGRVVRVQCTAARSEESMQSCSSISARAALCEAVMSRAMAARPSALEGFPAGSGRTTAWRCASRRAVRLRSSKMSASSLCCRWRSRGIWERCGSGGAAPRASLGGRAGGSASSSSSRSPRPMRGFCSAGALACCAGARTAATLALASSSVIRACKLSVSRRSCARSFSSPSFSRRISASSAACAALRETIASSSSRSRAWKRAAMSALSARRSVSLFSRARADSRSRAAAMRASTRSMPVREPRGLAAVAAVSPPSTAVAAAAAPPIRPACRRSM